MTIKGITNYFKPQNTYKKPLYIEDPRVVENFTNKIQSINSGRDVTNIGQGLSKCKQRFLDLIFATIIAIPSGIIFILTVPILKFAQPKSSLFHKQKRCGQNGKPLYVKKIRTVEQTSDGWRKSSKFAKLIRQYSIDEIPQLINVFKGDMSLAGPRALRYMEIIDSAESDIDFIADKLLMKPGFGFGYKKGRKLEKPREELERAFIQNHGLKDYLKIIKSLIKTIVEGNNL